MNSTETPLRPLVEFTHPQIKTRYRVGSGITLGGYGTVPIGMPIQTPVRFRAGLMAAESGHSAFDQVFASSNIANPRRVEFVYTIPYNNQITAGLYLLTVQMLHDEEEPIATNTILIEVVDP